MKSKTDNTHEPRQISHDSSPLVCNHSIDFTWDSSGGLNDRFIITCLDFIDFVETDESDTIITGIVKKDLNGFYKVIFDEKKN